MLGFKGLHDAVPETVGECRDNQAFAVNGDAIQHTHKGLMVWRKADNWTAFTDGNKTWVALPDSVRTRYNNQRFPEESDYWAYTTKVVGFPPQQEDQIRRAIALVPILAPNPITLDYFDEDFKRAFGAAYPGLLENVADTVLSRRRPVDFFETVDSVVPAPGPNGTCDENVADACMQRRDRRTYVVVTRASFFGLNPPYSDDDIVQDLAISMFKEPVAGDVYRYLWSRFMDADGSYSAGRAEDITLDMALQFARQNYPKTSKHYWSVIEGMRRHTPGQG